MKLKDKAMWWAIFSMTLSGAGYVTAIVVFGWKVALLIVLFRCADSYRRAYDKVVDKINL